MTYGRPVHAAAGRVRPSSMKGSTSRPPQFGWLGVSWPSTSRVVKYLQVGHQSKLRKCPSSILWDPTERDSSHHSWQEPSYSCLVASELKLNDGEITFRLTPDTYDKLCSSDFVRRCLERCSTW